MYCWGSSVLLRFVWLSSWRINGWVCIQTKILSVMTLGCLLYIPRQLRDQEGKIYNYNSIHRDMRKILYAQGGLILSGKSDNSWWRRQLVLPRKRVWVIQTLQTNSKGKPGSGQETFAMYMTIKGVCVCVTHSFCVYMCIIVHVCGCGWWCI